MGGEDGTIEANQQHAGAARETGQVPPVLRLRHQQGIDFQFSKPSTNLRHSIWHIVSLHRRPTLAKLMKPSQGLIGDRLHLRQLVQRILVLTTQAPGPVFALNRQEAAAIRARLRQWPVPTRELARVGIVVLVVGATVEDTAAPGLLFDQIATVERAFHTDFNQEGARIAAGRGGAAANEISQTAPASDQRLAARRARFADLFVDLDLLDRMQRVLDVLLERLVKLAQDFGPVLLAVGALLKLFFHSGREPHVDD